VNYEDQEGKSRISKEEGFRTEEWGHSRPAMSISARQIVPRLSLPKSFLSWPFNTPRPTYPSGDGQLEHP
jgi:hypothetical protein